MTYDHKNSLRRQDWLVKDVNPREAREFIAQHHYAKGSSLTRVYSHGLYRADDNDTLWGVALWLPPTRVAAESVNKEAWQKVLSLSRLACLPNAPKNAASFLLAKSVALIRQDERFVSLVTYADERMGHTGAIYRAANWTYAGRMKGSPAWIDPATGKQVAVKSTVNRTTEQMRALGYENIGTFGKHKYVMHLCARREQDGRGDRVHPDTEEDLT
jgi:hypothetical protein